MEEAGYLVTAEIDGLNVDLGSVGASLDIASRMVLYVCEHDGHKSAGERLRKWYVHGSLTFQIDKCTQSQSKRLQGTWTIVWISKCFSVETLSEFYQVNIVAP